jgi:mannosyltransferase
VSAQSEQAASAAASGPARPGPVTPAAGTRSSRGEAWSIALPPAVMLAIGLWSVSGASFWRDEASTLSAIRRPLPALWQMLGRTDAVHGFYYLLMWPVATVLGTSELDVRLPSVLAMSAAALGVAAIGRRLVSARVGLMAGLTFDVLPVTSRYAQEARSYALVTALAVLASYLLVLADATPGQRGRPPLGRYALALTVLGWANLMSLLLVPAHAVTRLWNARAASGSPAVALRTARDWLIAVTAGAALVPIIVLAWHERHGTERFLSVTSWASAGSVPDGLIGSWPVLAITVPLAAAGIWRADPGHAALTRLALPWLALPAPVLLAVGLFTPDFSNRYILFCVPAVALLAASGLDKLIALVAEHRAAAAESGARGTAIAAAAIAAIAALGLPSQLAYREPAGHLDNFRLLARTLAVNERPGDAILYAPPYWRQVSAAYPAAFARLRDIALARTPVEEDNFTGTQVTTRQLMARLGTVRRAWVIQIDPFRPYQPLDGDGWHVTRRWPISDFTLILYARSCGDALGTRCR